MNSPHKYKLDDIKLLSFSQMLQRNVESALQRRGIICLSIENIDKLPEIIKQLNYSYTADEIKARLGAITNLIRSSKLTIEFYKNTDRTFSDKQLEYINSILSEITSKSVPNKYSLTCLLGLLCFNLFNRISTILLMADARDYKLWDSLYQNGCESVTDLRMKINPKLRKLYGLYDLEYASWGSDFNYKTTRYNCYYVEGYSSDKKYYYDYDILMFPQAQLIGAYLLLKYNGRPQPIAIEDTTKGTNDHVITTSSNILNITPLKALYSTGQLARGKTKIPKSTLKKAETATSFTEIPTIGFNDFNVPSHIMTELFVSAAPDLKSDLEVPALTRKLFLALKSINSSTASMLTGNSVSSLCNNFFKNDTNDNVNLLFLALANVLSSAAAQQQNKWYELNSLIDAVK